MRYELRDEQSIIINLDIINPPGTGVVVGVKPQVQIYNIYNQQWLFRGGGAAAAPIYGWSSKPPVAATMPDYSFDMLPFQPAPGVGLMDGLWTFDMTVAHLKLEGGSAVFTHGAPPAGNNDSGLQGYYIRIFDPATPILQYLHIMPVNREVKDVNVVRWNGLGVSTTGGLPDINVQDYAGHPAQCSGPMRIPDVNVLEWVSVQQAGSTTGLPKVDVEEYADNAVSVGAPGIPQVDLVTVNNSPNAGIGLQDFGENGYDPATSKVNVVKTVDRIDAGGIVSGSFAADSITASAIADGAIDEPTFATDAISNRVVEDGTIDEDTFVNNAITANVIAGGAIDEDTFADDAISNRVIADGAIDEDTFVNNAITADVIADGAIDESAFADNAISNRVIEEGAIDEPTFATDAISERVMATGSITYEELSDSAIREIVNGVWGTSVFRPIATPPDTTDYGIAGPGTMGNVMLIDFLSRNLVRNPLPVGDPTSMHQSDFNDPTGTKFYSKSLALRALSAEEQKGYIDRTAVLFKGFLTDGSVVPADLRHYLVRISSVNTDGLGQYFEINLVDEDESPVPGGISAGSGPSAGDLLLIKAETDPTMHEIAHEVWEEPVGDHETPDTFGMLNRIMAGLSQYNHRITDSHYDQTGRLLSCRLVVYANADDAKDGINPLTTIFVNSDYDEKQNMTSFVASEET